MKKHCLFFVALLLMYSAEGLAQKDERDPGLYTVVGGESVPLPYTYSGTVNVKVEGGVAGFSTNKCNYKGVTSGVNASDTLVLVIDLERSGGVISPWEYNNFHARMTPEDMLILPLLVNQEKERREYDSGFGVGVGIGPVAMVGTTNETERLTFQWERISDNSFQVVVPNLISGEYGVVLRSTRYAAYDVHYLFAFTIAEAKEETAESK